MDKDFLLLYQEDDLHCFQQDFSILPFIHLQILHIDKLQAAAGKNLESTVLLFPPQPMLIGHFDTGDVQEGT